MVNFNFYLKIVGFSIMQKYSSRFIGSFVLLLLFISIGLPVMGQSNTPNLNYNASTLTSAWNEWRDTYVTSNNVGDSSRRRVRNDSGTTFSEGQAYGMLFASLFNEQNLFDGLFLYARDHFNANGLMNWHVQGTRVIGTGAATDGDLDMAIALMVACHQVSHGNWSASSYGIDYCTEAQAMINAIWTHEVDKPGNQPSAGLDNNQGYELIPGDSWNLRNEYPQGIVNLSYFSPAYFRAFAEFTNNSGWYDVIHRNYAIAELASQDSCAGFVSNWNTYNGDVQTVPWHGATSAYWGWDAARFAWRVALDRHWYDTQASRDAIQPIGSFFASVGINNVRAEYRLDGTNVNSYSNSYFTSTAAAAIWAAPSLDSTNCGQASGSVFSNPQDAYNAVVGRKENTYYADSWRLLTMLLITGNFPEPFSDGTPPPTPDPTEEVTPDPTEEITPEPTEDATPDPTEEITPEPTDEPTDEPNRSPIVSVVQNQSNQAGESISLQIVASDPDGDLIRYIANGLPTGLSMNEATGLISGITPTGAVGQYNVTITVMDTKGASGNMSFTWEITPAPVITPDVTEESTNEPPPPPPTSGMQVALWGATESNNQSQFRLRLTNATGSEQSNIATRLYFTTENGHPASDYVLDIYWDSSGAANLSAPIHAEGNVHYFEISYGSAKLAPNAEWILQMSLHLSNWQNSIDMSNDWWRQGGFEANYAINNNVPLYVNGAIAAGSQPDGSTAPPPTQTDEPVVTVEPTNPPLPTAIPTLAPTAIPTEPPVTQPPNNGNVELVIRGSGTVNEQQAQFQLRVVNSGNTPLSNASVRLYFTPDNGNAANHYILERYWDSSGAVTITGPISEGNQHYYILNYGAAQLAAGSYWEYHGNLRTADWSMSLNGNNDWWLQGGLASDFTTTTTIPVYVNNALVAGSQP